MITPADLNDLIQNQFALFSWLEDNPTVRTEEPSIFDEENRDYFDLNGNTWSYARFRTEIEFTDRSTGITVLIDKKQKSPFEFSTKSLLRFLLTKYEDSKINDVVIENWIVRMIPTGRVVYSDYTPDFFAMN